MKEMNNKQVIFLSVLPFSSPRVSSTKRIGPHNYVILCILIGSLLGDGSMEKDGNGSRFCFFFFKENMFNMYCDLIKNC